MKAIVCVLTALIILTAGCSSKPATSAEVKTDLEAMLYKKGIEYMSMQIEDAKVTLDMRFCKISDLTPLGDYPIVSINLQGNPLSDLTPLQGMPLTRLDISETKVTDLSPLKGLQLVDLNLDKTEVSDLSPLSGMPLEWISMDKCSKITSLSALSGAPLKLIKLSGTGVTDVSPLSGMSLESVWFSPSKIRNKSVFQGMSSLKKIGGDTFLTVPPEQFWEKHGG